MNLERLREIPRQRARSWADFHPEDHCRRCGEPNIVWFAASETWNALMRAAGGDKPEPYHGIICPVCFAQLWELAFGEKVWELRMEVLP